MTHSTPPETTDTRTLNSDATTPASKLPSAGPDVYDSISIDASRPRSESGIVWFQIVCRKTPLIMSAPPASARNASAATSPGTNPNPTIATPQTVAAAITPSPWRCTRDVQPEVAENSSAPTAGAAYIRPSTFAPPIPPAIAGNSAIGMPKNIATMSTAYVPMSSGRDRAYRTPSITRRMLRRSASGGGGTARITYRQTSPKLHVPTSTTYVSGRPNAAMRTPPIAGPAICPTVPRRL